MNTGYGFLTISGEPDMLAPSIIGVGFSVCKAHNYETFYSPAQSTLVELQFRCKFRNGSMPLFFNSQKHVALPYGNTAADGISVKLFSELTLEFAKAFPELFYALGARVVS